MAGFLYGVFLQWKLNMRDKEVLIVYYVVPLIFFVFMGSVFTSIIPDAYETLIQSMTIFGVTMGGVIGSPSPLIELFSSEIKKSYQVGHIPLWSIALSHFLSGFIHLFIMSMIIFIVAPILFDALIPVNLINYFLSLTITIIVSLGVGMIFGLYVKKTSQVAMVSQVVFLPSVMLSGIMFPVSLLPDVLQSAGKIIPATWCYEVMCSTNILNSHFLVLAITIIIIFIVCLWKLIHIYKEN